MTGSLNLTRGHGRCRRLSPLDVWPEFRFTRCLERLLSKSSLRSRSGRIAIENGKTVERGK